MAALASAKGDIDCKNGARSNRAEQMAFPTRAQLYSFTYAAQPWLGEATMHVRVLVAPHICRVRIRALLLSIVDFAEGSCVSS